MRNEFSYYRNYDSVDLGPGHWTYGLNRYTAKRSLADAVDDLEQGYEDVEELASDCIEAGDIDKLNVTNGIETGLDRIVASMELYNRWPMHGLN